MVTREWTFGNKDTGEALCAMLVLAIGHSRENERDKIRSLVA